jgi:biopolymer transport protein TolR
MAMQNFDASSSHVMADINVTPMVDVMLVLLIIFMVVTPAIVAGFEAQLPQGQHLKERPETENRVTLGIDAAGRYYLDKRPVAADQLESLLAQQFASRPEDKVLFLKADKSLKYGQIRAAMELARTAGVRVIAAVTEQAPPPKADATKH